MRYNRNDVKNRWRGVLGALGVDDSHLTGRNVPCPLCGGVDRFRFLNTDGAGTWCCNQCGAGDGMHLVQKFCNVSFKEAVKMVMAEVSDVREIAPSKPRDMRPILREMWGRSLKPEHGRDPVARYLEARHVWAGGLSSDIRYLPEASYYHNGDMTGKHPAMIACVRDMNNVPTTVHVTYLDGLGRKADVPTQKKVLSSMGEGAHINLIHSLVPGDCRLNVAEGIETALAGHGLRGGSTYATISASGMSAFVVPDWVRELTIWGDNDANFTGQAAAYALANKASKRRDLKIEVLIPQDIGTDWADWRKRDGDL